MALIPTPQLKGKALDYAVALCEGLIAENGFTTLEIFSGSRDAGHHRYCTYWSQGGPIIEREDISFRKYHNPKNENHGTYYAQICRESGSMVHWSKQRASTGPTPLIAAMRCYVASKLGSKVEIPDELLEA